MVRQQIGALRRGARTVRGRSTLLASVVVAVAMVLGSMLLLAVYRNQLTSSLDQSLEQQVLDRARLIDQGSDPQSLVTVLQDEEALVWIGTPDGVAVAVSPGMLPLENPVPETVGGVTAQDLLVLESEHAEEERELVELRLASASAADGQLVVLAGAESETVTQAVTALGRLFLIGLPPLLALVAGLTWLTTGRALKPVEGIRSRAADISGTNLSGRVDVPDTGDEIEHLAITVNAMLDRIESHDYSLRQFTADASHELKSPVANLRALVDTANIGDPGWSALRGQLAGESDRLRNLVDNLLFLASTEAGAPSAANAAISLDELLFDEAQLVAATGDVVVDLAGVSPAILRGSPTDLGRLVRNLVDNAVRHAATTISLAIETDGGGTGDGQPVDDGRTGRQTVTLVVGDDGPGINPDDRERVFERFTRLDEGRARGEGGSGLGLAIVRHIAETHNATVSIGVSPLGGAEFRVRFIL